MQKNIVSFKKLKGKIIKNRKEKKMGEEKRGKEKKKKRKAPQNGKSPTQKQRFITTINSVTEYTHIHIYS